MREHAEAASHAIQEGILEAGVTTRNWYLKFSQACHTMSSVLGLKRLQELIQGTCSLSEEPLWLLGLWYGLHDTDTGTESLPAEMQQLLLEDFSSKFWFTYRRDFPPLGPPVLSSDVGWGCTIRSGQMMMAEALARCWWGRTTQLYNTHSTPQAAAASFDQAAAGSSSQEESSAAAAAGQAADAETSAQRRGVVPDELPLLRLFLDQPGPSAPFSIHNICRAGAHHGVVPGQWLGPWVLCKALAAAAADYQQQQQQPLGLQVHVACDPGGGAPALQLDRLKQLLAGHHSSSAADDGGREAAASQAGGGSSSSAAGSSADAGQQQARQQAQQQPGLLLLVPLTLGVGRVDERYLPQLAAVLTFPQSVGIVGGRPGASLYFLGAQGSAVLYLDPHEVQEVVALPEGAASYHCSTPRLMPLTSIDPSLAIGFYCSSAGELDDLSSRLQQLASGAGGAPLMTVDTDAARQQQQGTAAWRAVAEEGQRDAGGDAAEDWELV